ncbi:MAG: hypothetical protein IID37_09380 [Planctomycetes bacterium]|nr:hypothetical protein [Planctomycetota bacterium]
MKSTRMLRWSTMLVSGAVMLQLGGCSVDLSGVFDFLQTAFLGITAAGAIAILQNI